MTREIPREEWTDELDSFSKEHEGWIVSVRIKEPGGQSHTQVRDSPLEGVSVDDPQKRHVAISTGIRADDHMTHEIADPVRIIVELTDDGADSGLCIEAADGSTTSVEFMSPMRVDQVDGVSSPRS